MTFIVAVYIFVGRYGGSLIVVRDSTDYSLLLPPFLLPCEILLVVLSKFYQIQASQRSRLTNTIQSVLLWEEERQLKCAVSIPLLLQWKLAGALEY